MATPKTFSKTYINTTSDQDALQVKDVTGEILGWIDSTGTGQGNLASGGGGGTPANPSTSVQFNNSGSFGGSANLTFDTSNVILSVGASPNSLQLGHLPTSGNITDFIELHNNTSVVVNSNYRVGGLSLFDHSGNSGPCVNLARSNGTQASPTVVGVGDVIGRWTFLGWNGSAYNFGVQINCQVTETWNTSAQGASLLFTNVKTGTTTSQQTLGLLGDTSIIQSAPSSAPTDGNLTNSSISFYVDEIGNNLKVRVKYSNGTLKTATIALV
jgi:hypothetical protein